MQYCDYVEIQLFMVDVVTCHVMRYWLGLEWGYVGLH